MQANLMVKTHILFQRYNKSIAFENLSDVFFFPKIYIDSNKGGEILLPVTTIRNG